MSYGNYGVPQMPDKNGLVSSYLSYIRLYRDPNRVKIDSQEVFRFFPNLHPYYQQSDRGTLIYLKGTIPIIYNNFNYFLPIKITIPIHYPEHGPQIALDPTPEMFVVKGHPQVDEYGNCILKNWNHLTSISQVLKYLCDTFSFMPPLQSRSSSSSTSSTASTNTQQQPHRNLPNTPTTQNIPVNNNIINSNNSNSSPPPYGSSPTNWNPQPPPSYNHSIANKTTPPPQVNNSPPLPNKQLPPTPTPQPQQPVIIDERSELIHKCTIKLQVELSKFYEETGIEIIDFQGFNQSLEKRLKDLTSQRDNLNKDLEYSEKNILNLTSESEKLEKLVKELEQTTEQSSQVDVDLVLGPSAPLSKQLLTLNSENQLIEELLYYLDKALNSSTITLDEYLKNVRSLSRDQFMVRATIKKVQNAIQSTRDLALQQLNLSPSTVSPITTVSPIQTSPNNKSLSSTSFSNYSSTTASSSSVQPQLSQLY